MKAGVVVFPGSNCDRDSLVTLENIFSTHNISGHVHKIWHGDTELPKLDLVIIPGGFSYGDYLRSGAMAAHSPIMQEIKKHANEGRLLIGICNGFQVLTEAGLLEGALMRNKKLHFICKDVTLKVEQNKNPFTNKYENKQLITVPIAHHDGNYFADDDTLKSLEDNEQVLFRYVNEEGEATEEANPNGSVNNIAGICNRSGNVVGMMPHPERVCDEITGGTDGRKLFESALSYVA